MYEELNFARVRRLPVVLGVEAAECGLACLTMVARYWGHDVDLNGLRQRYRLSISGATLRSIMEQANGLSLSSRALRIELEALPKLKLPAILHWDLNHFVVLRAVNKKSVTIHDPARGQRVVPLKEVSERFTGVALELAPTKEFRPTKAVAPTRIRDLWSEIEGFWPSLFHVLCLSVVLQIVVFAAPFQMQFVVDEAIGRNDIDLLTVLALGFGALVIVQALIEALRGWTITALGQMLSFQLVGNLVRHLLRLPTDWFEKRHVGDILSRLQSTAPIQDAITRGAVSALLDGLMGLIAGVILFLYSPLLALVVIASLLLSLGISLATYPAMRARTEEQIVTGAKESSHLMESVRASVTVKLMGREVQREAAWRNLFADTINASFSLAKYGIWVGFAQSIVFGVQAIVITWLAARLILEGDGFSVGMLFAFMSFRSTFTDRVGNLINQLIQFRLLGLHLDRIGDIVQAEAEPIETKVSVAPPEGRIELRQVNFRYGAADRLVLEGVNLTVEPGEFVALVGPSGAGKSTICKLMLGLYPPTAGVVLLDDKPASSNVWRQWRRHVGVVSQDDRLLSGSIADNIAFFDPDLDMAQVTKAAVAARVDADIAQMPMTYQTLVGDMGSALSGGQRQRVLLARALYRNPSILILDEGTANLDLETEQEIADLISRLAITRVVIAHRPALVERASRVILVKGGIATDTERITG
ncbi:MAG: peptidase domain-containing ABC transporter [Hyphomonadaceae bacterium]